MCACDIYVYYMFVHYIQEKYPQWIRFVNYMKWYTDHSLRVFDNAGDFPLRVLAEVPVGQVLKVRHVARGWARLAHNVHVAVVVYPQLAHYYIVHCRRYLPQVKYIQTPVSTVSTQKANSSDDRINRLSNEIVLLY